MAIKALAQGDFATKVPKLKNNDEFGRLLGNLETMRSDLGGLFQKIKRQNLKVTSMIYLPQLMHFKLPAIQKKLVLSKLQQRL